MNAKSCSREDELLDALGRGFLGPEMEAHLEECLCCSELHLVAGALLDDRRQAVREAAVPSSGTMWWRMRVRQHHEAQSKVRSYLLVGQAATLMIAITLVFAFFGAEVAAGVRELIATIRLSTPLLLAVATWALLAPIAGWVATRQK